jgi:hypothetical protein
MKPKFKALVEYSYHSKDDPAHYTEKTWEYYSTFDQPTWLKQNVIVKDLQYIGIRSDNNEEIFEGDFIKLDSTDIGGKVYVGEVVWCDDQTLDHLGWGLWVHNGGYLSTDFLGNITILGNVYENPELMKK